MYGKNRLRLLIFSQYFWPENFRINDIALFLKKKNYIEILTTFPSYPKKSKFDYFYLKKKNHNNYKKIIVNRFNSYKRNTSNISIIMNYLSFIVNAVFYIIFKFKKKFFTFDAIFVFSPSPIFNIIPAILIKKLFKIKLYVWVLDLWPDTLIDLFFIKNKFLKILLFKFCNLVYNQADIIFVQSKSQKKTLSKRLVVKCHKIYAWPEEDVLNSKVGINKDKIKKNKKILNLLFAGNIGQAQDFESLIKAAEILQSKIKIKWIILGSGRYKNNLITIIKKKNLQENFILIDSVEPKNVKSYFDCADALVVTLKKMDIFKKTIPGKLQTYLASGIPILGMISGEAKKIIQNAKCGYVSEAGNFRDFAQKIIKFKTLNTKKKIIMGKNGKKFSHLFFNKNYLLTKLQKYILEDIAK